MTIELLKVVLDEDVVWFNQSENIIEYNCFGSGENKSMNIYELMHLMIIYAATENFKLEHELCYGIERGRARLIQYQEYDMYDVFGYKIGRDSKSDWFNEDSIPAAVTSACEWIRLYKGK